MKTRRMLIVMAIVAVGMFWSLPAGAYGVFTGANNCNQCHDTWPGSEHTLHSSQFACSLCHVGGVGVNPVEPTSCLQCHDTTDLFVLHGPLTDGDGFQCGYCHEGVTAEGHSWTDLKNIFE